MKASQENNIRSTRHATKGPQCETRPYPLRPKLLLVLCTGFTIAAVLTVLPPFFLLLDTPTADHSTRSYVIHNASSPSSSSTTSSPTLFNAPLHSIVDGPFTSRMKAQLYLLFMIPFLASMNIVLYYCAYYRHVRHLYYRMELTQVENLILSAASQTVHAKRHSAGDGDEGTRLLNGQGTDEQRRRAMTRRCTVGPLILQPLRVFSSPRFVLGEKSSEDPLKFEDDGAVVKAERVQRPCRPDGLSMFARQPGDPWCYDVLCAVEKSDKLIRIAAALRENVVHRFEVGEGPKPTQAPRGRKGQSPAKGTIEVVQQHVPAAQQSELQQYVDAIRERSSSPSRRLRRVTSPTKNNNEASSILRLTVAAVEEGEVTRRSGSPLLPDSQRQNSRRSDQRQMIVEDWLQNKPEAEHVPY